mgnify:CR=1 FL=1
MPLRARRSASHARGFALASGIFLVVILALLAARFLAEPVAELLSGLIDSADARLVLAFILVILGVVIASGIGESMHLKFTLDLAGEKSPVKADVTDVSKW